MPSEDELLTLEEAAQEIGVNPQTLYRAITRSKTLNAIRKGPLWMVTRKALNDWNDNPANKRRGPKRKQS